MEKESNKAKFVAPRCKFWADKKKMLGLDLGIASIGWCLYWENDEGELLRIIDIGSFVFNQIENPKSGQTENIARRIKRLMRRQRRRRVLRLESARRLFKKDLGLDFETLIAKREVRESPFDIKVKGLHDELSKEELAIALYHYLKYRGFKSNRKNEKTSDASDKKMLGGIAEVQSKLSAVERPLYVTEYLKQRFDSETDKTKKRYHNTSTDYFLTVSNDMYKREIEALLDKQIEYGVINKEFRGKYIKLFNRRRDYSEGPQDGPYKVDFGVMAGTCVFDGERRACKDAYDAQKFILLSSLNNLRYKTDLEGEYRNLTPEQIQKAANVLIWKADVKYSALFKAIGLKDVRRVKGIELTRKEYREAIRKFAEENGIPDGHSIPDELNDKLNDFVLKKTFDKVFFKGSRLLPKLEKCFNSAGIDKEDRPSKANDIAEILFLYKTDERILKACNDQGYSDELQKHVLALDGASETINLSLPICQKLNEIMIHGVRYDEAMEQCGYRHSEHPKLGENALMPSIEEAVGGIKEYLTNPVVKHTLVQMRRLINAIVREYGAPTHYNIELARELKKNFQDRRKIRNNQEDNRAANIALKTEMIEKYPQVFRSFRDISAHGSQGDNLLKYKLFKEQGGISPYTGNPIDERYLFDKDRYQIDHIVPYSISFDDSFSNKVVVEAKENQNKRNRLPLAYFESIGRNRAILDSFLRTHHVDLEKRDNLLRKNLQDDFLHKDASDNSYIATLARKLIDYYMLPEGVHCGSTSGAITSKLRRLWGLSGRTHSFDSSLERDYRAKTLGDYKYQEFSVCHDEDKGDGVIFTFLFQDRPLSFEVFPELKGRGSKDAETKKPTFTKKQIEKNQAIQTFILCQTDFQQRFSYCLGQDINALQDTLSGRRVDSEANVDSKFVDGLLVLSYVYEQIQGLLNEKDRSNHLHHALDAAVIGASTPGLIQRLTKFYQDEEADAYDPVTGEIRLLPPLPYPDFRKEVLSRVYERNIDVLLNVLNGLENYESFPATKENTHVLIPVRLPEKDVVGAISAETIYGVDSRSGALTQRVGVDKLTKKNVENIFDKDDGNKAVYEACKKWVYHKTTQFPILEPKGNIIRSVKLLVANSSEGKVDLSRGRYADNSDNIRVDVYRKNGDDNTLYFVPIYYYQLSRERIRNKQIANHLDPKKVVSEAKYTIMWSQGEDGTKALNKRELKASYQLIGHLPRCSFVEIEKNDGSKGFAYSLGVTTGMLEVMSPLGDEADLLNSGLFKNWVDRLRLTVSTIQNLKIRSITILGKIN